MNKISRDQVANTYKLRLFDLLKTSSKIHEKHFELGKVQTSQLLSIKTGGCPENCAYCPQSAHYSTGVKKEALLTVEQVKEKAKAAKDIGATRFCMGAAWREVKDGKDFDRVLEMVRSVDAMDMEVCCTLGMINKEQAVALKEAGLYAYNHNIDTSENFYKEIIQTRKFENRLKTIENVRNAGITVCTGGIIGMGESDEDRIDFIHTLANLDPQPESVTINTLIPIEGTPLEKTPPIDTLTLVRVISTVRILAPKAMIRLSAGRTERSTSDQFLCFYAGANSIFLGDTLLTSPNPAPSKDQKMFDELGLQMMR